MRSAEYSSHSSNVTVVIVINIFSLKHLMYRVNDLMLWNVVRIFRFWIVILFRLCNSQHIGITIHWPHWCHTFLNPQLLISQGPSWSYGSWIYNYIYNQGLSPLTLWVRTPPRRGVLDTTLCDKVCQWLAAGQLFSPDTPVSSINKTDRHNITKILLKVA